MLAGTDMLDLKFFAVATYWYAIIYFIILYDCIHMPNI